VDISTGRPWEVLEAPLPHFEVEKKKFSKLYIKKSNFFLFF
jgi:hypothetical protein